MAREELLNPDEERLGTRRVPRRQHFRNDAVIGNGLNQPAFEYRLDFGGEQQPVSGDGPVQRLHAEPIAGEQQPPPWRVPERKRKHAAEPVHAVVTPLLVGMHDRLGVRPGPIAVPRGFEHRPHGSVVVDLAVVRDPDAAVLVRQRLMPAGKVHDAEAAMGQRGLIVSVQAGAVRAAIRDDVAHHHGAPMLVLLQAVGRDDPRDPAHQAALTRTAFPAGCAAASPSMNSRTQNSSIRSDHSRRP